MNLSYPHGRSWTWSSEWQRRFSKLLMVFVQLLSCLLGLKFIYRISKRGRLFSFWSPAPAMEFFFSSAHPVGVETFSVLVNVCPEQMTDARNFLAIFMEYHFSSFCWKSGRLLWKLYGNSNVVLAVSWGHATFALEKLILSSTGLLGIKESDIEENETDNVMNLISRS